MDQLDDRLEPEDENRLADAAPLGRSSSTMSRKSLTEYAGASWAAFNLLESRIAVLDSGATGYMAANLDTRMINELTDAGPLGRSKSKMTHAELTEYSGVLYLGLDSLAARVDALDSLGLGGLHAALESSDNDKLAEAGASGRSKSQMDDVSLTEWAGATDAAYNALETRVSTLESAT